MHVQSCGALKEGRKDSAWTAQPLPPSAFAKGAGGASLPFGHRVGLVGGLDLGEAVPEAGLLPLARLWWGSFSEERRCLWAHLELAREYVWPTVEPSGGPWRWCVLRRGVIFGPRLPITSYSFCNKTSLFPAATSLLLISEKTWGNVLFLTFLCA